MAITLINDAPMGSSHEQLVKQLNNVVNDLAALKATFDAHQHTALNAAPAAAYIAAGANAFNPTVQQIILKK